MLTKTEMFQFMADSLTTGWTTDAFRDLGTFARYALPGMAMLSLEFFGYELGTILAGIYRPVQDTLDRALLHVE